jgi:asparagine synthase (glutamine-hydrolysing)
MCGIAGILALDGRPSVDRRLLDAMNQTLVHRGPDSAGVYEEDGRVGLAMRRLAIIDVAGGDQPIATEDQSVWIVFNGEIYNFPALRHELESRGHRFRTRSDTESIVHAYEEWGDDCVTRLRGMFAFALWDAANRRLLLARDRVGEKQLFYAEVDGQLVFGSEIKAILAHPRVERRLRPAALNHFLTYLYVPEPLTMFEGIHELRAGHVLVAERGGLKIRPYWQLRYDPDPTMSLETAAEGLRAHLDEAVRMRLVSDVPLGAFLSGGIDSGSVVALMARHSDAPVRTFTVGYARGGGTFDERAHARELAARYGTEHHELEIEPDLVGIATSLVRAFDQPLADSSAIPTWYLSQLARRHVTVALSGLGGDEVAAGYERHRGALLAERLRWLPGWAFRRILQPAADLLPDPRSGNQWPQRAKRFVRAAALPFDERYLEMLTQLAREARAQLLTPEILEQIDLDDPRDHFHGYMQSVGDADPLNRALYADLKLYLPGNLLTLTDRMSMAHSLEVRVPFLDHELLEFAARLPPSYKLRGLERKHILKRAVRDLLPESFFRRRKMGFSPPITVWFRNQLRPFAEDTLSESAIGEGGVFRYAAVRRLLDAHFARRANYDNQIWALITFMLWQREHLPRPWRA